MFVVSEADSDAIRAVLQQDGELSAAIELQRRFPGVVDNAKAREWARIIASWGPPPARAVAKSAATQTDGTTGAALPLTGKKASEFQGKDEGEIAFIIKMLSKTPHRAIALCVTPTRPNATDRDYGLFRSAGQTQA